MIKQLFNNLFKKDKTDKSEQLKSRLEFAMQQNVAPSNHQSTHEKPLNQNK